MFERLFEESCAITGFQHIDRLKAVPRRSLRQRISPCRQRAGYAVDIGGQSWSLATALEPDSLSDRDEQEHRAGRDRSCIGLGWIMIVGDPFR